MVTRRSQQPDCGGRCWRQHWNRGECQGQYRRKYSVLRHCCTWMSALRLLFGVRGLVCLLLDLFTRLGLKRNDRMRQKRKSRITQTCLALSPSGFLFLCSAGSAINHQRSRGDARTCVSHQLLIQSVRRKTISGGNPIVLAVSLHMYFSEEKGQGFMGNLAHLTVSKGTEPTLLNELRGRTARVCVLQAEAFFFFMGTF